MKSRAVKIFGLVVGGILVLGLWVFLAPAKLGGSTNYSVTSGISMQPLLHNNDLALVRAQSSYHVGDVVLYQSQVVHRPVLHRILLIQNGNYFFKGDNNNFVDPGYATRNELTGKLWLHLAGIGALIGWFGKPLHAALLASFAATLVILTSFTSTRPRRHQHDRSMAKKGWFNTVLLEGKRALRRLGLPHSARGSAATTMPQQAVSGRIPSFLEGPTPTLVLLVILLILAVSFLIVGFGRPAHRLAPLAGAFQQTGSFAYTAAVKQPTPVYPSGTVTTSEPIYSSLVDSVTLHFKYQFKSALPHSIKGTIELRALLLSQADTWQELTVVKPLTKFTGDNSLITSDLALSGLYGLIDSVAAESGSAVTNYSADIQPVIHITGIVGGKPIKETFEPVLPFNITRSVITLNDQITPAPPGATYVTPSESTARASTLRPVMMGSIPQLVANKISIAKYEIAVPLLRWLGGICAMLALLIVLVHNFIRNRQIMQSDEELIASQSETLILPVATLPLPTGDVIIEVPDFERLTELAQFLERPIFYEINDGTHIYAVDDDKHRYITRLSEAISSPTTAMAPATGQEQPIQPLVSSPIRHRTWSLIIARGGAGLFVLAVIATLATSLTASTNVPTSNVGRSVNAVQVSQLAPVGCSALTLTSIVFANGTSSNSLSHVLILGNASVNTLTDTGTGNCIVGGAGKDRATAPSTDICIIGPTSGTNYGSCTTKIQ